MTREQGKEAAVNTVGGDDAALIGWHERDHELGLHEDTWGESLKPSWRSIDKPARHFTRELQVSDTPEIEIAEYVVRFPSVPIYGINRKADYNIEFPRRPNMHTLRVLRNAKHKGPVTRVFILHNGLNETRNLRFYYRLAAWILREDEELGHRTACLVAPFPGHLMHAPFPGPFAQTPLARYLADSGDLFRQFLRYMVEMRWILSLLMRRRPESWAVGGMPLKRSTLASTLLEQCLELRRASRRVWEARRLDPAFDSETERRLVGDELDETTVQSTLDVLTHVLGLDQDESPVRMPVHVVGYSLGGFLAQSVFFAWPNMVSSCTTICSGGAIRALSPTAFAHSEEWQAVLHTLRPELEESMLGGRMARSLYRVAGMDEDQFVYYQRIFDQVFLQEDKASYKARLSEYGTRLLFVSGGDDPIVKTQEVLDASPKEGITMLSVASLTHFLGEEPLTHREIEQREFWLPEAGGLVGRATARAEKLHAQERRDARSEYQAIQLAEKERDEGKLEESERTAVQPGQRDLGSPEFEGALDWVIDGVKSKVEGVKVGEGWLFICRSGIPAAFLGSEMHRAWGAGLHHHDVNIQKYAAGLAIRAATLRGIHDRTTLVLPSGLRRTFVESSSGLVDPHSDAPGYLTTEKQREDAWETFMGRWGQETRWLHAGPIGDENVDCDRKAHRVFADAASRWQRVPSEHLAVTHLPDAWISLDNLRPAFDPNEPAEAVSKFVKWVAGVLAKEPPVPLQGAPARKAKSDAGKALEDDLRTGRLRIVRVSGAELNPRYRGRFEQAFWPALSLLAHCAAALVRSRADPKE